MLALDQLVTTKSKKCETKKIVIQLYHERPLKPPYCIRMSSLEVDLVYVFLYLQQNDYY